MSKKGGRRCVAGGCDNSNFDSYAVYTVATMKDEKTKKDWMKFVHSTRLDFDEKNAITVYICDGHFEEDCFKSSQKAQYMSGFRAKFPELNQDAVPTRKIATRPHFVKPSSYDERQDSQALAWRNTVVVEEPALAYIPPIMSSVVKTAEEDRTHVQLKRRSAKSAATNMTNSKKTKTESKSNRRKSALTLQKERLAMEAEMIANSPKHTEEDCKVPNCPEPHVMCTQTEPEIRHQQTQSDQRLSAPSRVPTKHKRVQFNYRPKRNHRGTQTPQQPKQEPAPNKKACTCSCTCQQAASLPAPQNMVDEEDIPEDDGGDGDNPVKDPDWELPEEDDLSESEEFDPEDQYLHEEIPAESQTKYIVFEANLMELFQRCPERSCGAPCNVIKGESHTDGSMLVVQQACTLCNFVRVWRSQPFIGNVPAGNCLLTSAILFAGTSPTKVLRVLHHMKVKAISQDTYLNHQKHYMQLAVVRTFKNKQAALIAELQQKNLPLILGGDGRCDSPGHCAKYGTYTMMDLSSGNVIDIQLVQSTEVQNSNAMELEGLKRSFAYLLGHGLTIGTIITDRHPSITKWLRENHSDVTHQFDVWHIAKSVKKQLSAVAKLKECGDAALWQKSIVNHLYWCASSTPNGDGELIAAKFHSLKNHLVNQHDGHSQHADFDECQHGDLSAEPRRWMKKDTRVYDKITEIICKPHLNRALKQMSPLEQTSNVEAFHGVMCMWAPKLLAYSYTGMKCRSYLAVLHWNENGTRDQAVNSDGSLRYKVSYPKQKKGGYTVKKVLTGITYGYVDVLIGAFVSLVKTCDKEARLAEPELQPMGGLCSGFEHPDKDDAIKLHLEKGRYARSVLTTTGMETSV